MEVSLKLKESPESEREDKVREDFASDLAGEALKIKTNHYHDKIGNFYIVIAVALELAYVYRISYRRNNTRGNLCVG
jgi:hypothetical protein